MANVKITDLTALSAGDAASTDVFVIVDVNADATKKITLSDATTAIAASNDFVTYTQLNSNLNTVSSNATAVETRRVANIAGAISSVLTSDLTASRAMVSDGSGKIAVDTGVTATELGYLDATSSIQTQIDTKIATTASASNDFVTYTRLNANVDIVQDNVAAVESRRTANLVSPTFTGEVNISDDLVVDGNLQVHGDTITANAINLIVQDQFIALSNGGTKTMDVGIFYNRGTEGNAAVWYDASATRFKLSETRDPFSNTTIAETSAANLTVGTLTTSELTLGAVALTASGTELNYVDGVSSAIQTQMDTKIATTVSASNDFVTYTLLNANVDVVQDNVAAVESRRTANIAGAVSSILTSDLTTSRVLNSDGSGKVAASSVTTTTLGYLDPTSSIQTQLDAKQDSITTSNLLITTGTGNTYNIGTAVANINETDVYLDGIYQTKSQYVLANSSHSIQFIASTLVAGLTLETVIRT